MTFIVQSLAPLWLFWPVIMEVLVVCMIGIFIWGLLRPLRRRVLVKALWGLGALAVLVALSPLVFFLAP